MTLLQFLTSGTSQTTKMADRERELQTDRIGKSRKGPVTLGRKKANSKREETATDQGKQRRKEIEASIRLQVAAEEKAHKIVEKLVLDEQVSEEFLVMSGRFITPSHYSDVTQERAIAYICGYPLCCETLKQIPKQKYKISTRTNRVFDITERKWFCSSFCYKASKWFESQLSSSPVWSRGQEEASAGAVFLGSGVAHELETSHAADDTGTAVVRDEDGGLCIQTPPREEHKSATNPEIKELTVAVDGLEVSPLEPDRTASLELLNPCTFAATRTKLVNDCPWEDSAESFPQTHSGEQVRLASGTGRIAEASDGGDKILLWSAIQVAREWCSQATLRFLGCEQPCDPGSSDISGEATREERVVSYTAKFPRNDTLASIQENLHRNEPGSASNKASPNNIVIKERQPPQQQDTGRVLPPIDSKSQMAIRRRIVLDKLTKTLPDLLREVRLTMGEISADLTRLVHTFRFGSHNITLKPVQWHVLCLALLETLRCTNPLVAAALDSNKERVDALLRSLGLTRPDFEGLVAVFIPSPAPSLSNSRARGPTPAAGTRGNDADLYYGDMEQLD